VNAQGSNPIYYGFSVEPSCGWTASNATNSGVCLDPSFILELIDPWLDGAAESVQGANFLAVLTCLTSINGEKIRWHKSDPPPSEDHAASSAGTLPRSLSLSR
jgi:hypothetical protein